MFLSSFSLVLTIFNLPAVLEENQKTEHEGKKRE